MQLVLSQLSAQLANPAKSLQALYVLHGDEILLVQEAADQIRAAARQIGFDQRSSFTVAGAHFDWGEVLAATSSPGLFAQRQIVELHIPSGKPGKEGSAALQQLAGQCQALSQQGNTDTLVVVVLPRLDKLTKSSAWFAALEQGGAALQIEPVERQALPQWIAQRLRGQGQCVEAGEAGQQTLQFFADRVEGNLLAAHQEIRKLALLYPPQENSARNAAADTPEHGPSATVQVLSLAQIQAAVMNVARYDVFKLSEAVLSGQPLRVMRMLDGLRSEGEAEVLVHWALAEDIAALKRVKDAVQSGRPLPLALREQRVWGVRERLFERLLPRLSVASLAALLQAAHQVDGIVKGLPAPGWPSNGWQALHRLAMQLCAQCLPVQTAPRRSA